MGQVRYVDFHPDEWIAGTISLSLAERGLYITACALIYSHGGPIEIDHLRGSCRDHGHTFNAALKHLLSLGKLVLDGTLIGNKRASKEVQNALKRVSNARQNGVKGGHPKDLAKPTGSEPPTTNHHIDSEEAKASPGVNAPSQPTDPVKDLWDRGLEILGNGQRSLLGKMRKRYKDAAVLEAIVACEQEQPSDPAAFFIRCCEQRARDAPQNYHQSPLGTLYEGAYRAAEAIIARQNRGNLSDREPPTLALLDGERTRRYPAGTA